MFINVLNKNLNQRSIEQRFTSLVEEKYYIGNTMLLQLSERAGDGHPKAEICPGFGEEGAGQGRVTLLTLQQPANNLVSKLNA